MKRIGFILLLALISNNLSAQFGISGRYTKNTNKAWSDVYQDVSGDKNTLFSSGIELGVNYWFRLKNYRVEFLPEITYATSKTDIRLSQVMLESHEKHSYHFNFNIQIYPLDFEGDCDCPTWSKDGNLIKKGFYWLFSPGIVQHSIATTPSAISSVFPEDSKMTSFRLGVGAGLDIGITDLFTVSPFAMYSINPSNEWASQVDLYQIYPVTIEKATINQWHAGIRLIFRPNYKG